MKKKILSVVMACVMAVSCCCGVMAMAAYNDNLQTTTIETNDGVIFEIKDGVEDSFVGGMRRDSYIAVDSSLNDKSGSQTIPFRTNSDYLSLIHILRCRRQCLCRYRWSPYH